MRTNRLVNQINSDRTEGVTTSNGLGKVGLASASVHVVFYAVFEAVMYIFTRRRRTFSKLVEDSPEEVEKLQFGAIINSPLNPLRVTVTLRQHHWVSFLGGAALGLSVLTTANRVFAV